MGVHSGKFATVNGMSTVRNWTIVDDITNPKYVASNTLGGTGRESGIQSWSGSFGFYGGMPSVLPGELFAFLGYTAPDNDISGAGMRASGNAMIDSVVITYNWANGDIISSVANFTGDLALVWASGVQVVDGTIPTVPSICGAKIETSDDGVAFTPLPNVTQAVLTITAANQKYVNSSTNCWTGVKAGPIDFTLAITREDNLIATLAKGSNKVVKVWHSATALDFWLLKWGKVKGFTGITANAETGEIIKHTVTLEKNGFVGGVVGTIRTPGDVAYWPAP